MPPAARPPGSRTTPAASHRPGALRCRGWQQEAALRMLENNLHPDVAENPEELVVYGGIGKAARNRACLEAIVRELQRLGDDETLLVQSGKPVGVFRTHEWAPRVLIGAQGSERILAEDVARRLGTINYEVTCGISARVPRVHHRDGAGA